MSNNNDQHQSPLIDIVYKANRDLLQNYHIQAARYLSVMYGYDYEEILKIIATVFIPRENGFKEAKFKIFRKNKVGDRVPMVVYARDYFKLVEENDWHLSPSLVAYTNANKEESVNAFGTNQFIAFRKLYKGKRQEVPKGTEAYAAFNEIQNALKIFNNAQSGGFSSSGTPLFNKSAHTSLTSTCRAVTSTANIINERLITGNRLLLSYNKTMELFISTLAYANRDLIASVVKKYNMNHATVPQVMDMVRHCSNYYWRDPSRLASIELFLKNLQPLELTILLCSMDLRGLYTTNPELMKVFFNEWCAIPEIPEDFDAEKAPKPMNSDYKTLCVTKLDKGATDRQIRHLNLYHMSLEVKWNDFMQAFFKAKVPPSGLFHVKEMVRENVLTSDTDSSIYSVDMIINDYVSDQKQGLCFNGVLTYFIRSIAVDQHARLSKNMNVAAKNLNRMNMKNEYLFSSYVTTAMSKHYYALQLMVEGVLNAEPDLELKGVHLRGVKIAQKVREFTNKLMRDVLDAIYDKRKLSAPHLLKEVADLERMFFEEIEQGGWSWLTKNTIKEDTAYTNPESSIYYYHELWEKVFADKYGHAPSLPYRAYKISLNMSNKTKLNTYLESIKESGIGIRLKEYLESRTYLTSVYIPVDMIRSMGGIPKEILPIVDSRLILTQNFKSIYTILESLGLFILNAKGTRIVSDEH